MPRPISSIPTARSLSGGSIELGTEQNPLIVVAQGDLDLAGNGSGCGLLIVKGELDYSGGFNYEGLILVVGDGSVNVGGANKSIIGGLFLARLELGRRTATRPSERRPSHWAETRISTSGETASEWL